MHFLSLQTTLDTEKNALKLANEIVKNNLGACVQIQKIISVYPWDNKIHNELEYVVTIKTTSKRVDALKTFIQENHPYDLPQIIVHKIVDGSDDYLDWIADHT